MKSTTVFLVVLLALSNDILVSTASPEDHCKVLDETNKKIVCVCNKDYCDEFMYSWPENQGEVHLISSTRDGRRYSMKNITNQVVSDEDIGNTAKIHLDYTVEKQTIVGWGGAFTDSNGLNIKSLSKEVGDKVMEVYFGENGQQYNFARVVISGCDFSTHPYTYDDTKEPDYNLTHWSLTEEDINYKIPYIKQALTYTNKRNVSLNLFGSSWSPPAWMKQNHNLTRGHLINDDRIYQSFADYLVKFYDAYKEHGIDFWGGTVQNEPLSANWEKYSFNSLQMTNEEYSKFIRFLGPTLEKHGYTKDKFKLLVGDDNLGLINNQVPQIMEQESVRKYVSGLAFHWYNSGTYAKYDSLLDVIMPVKNYIDVVLMTEACTGIGEQIPVDLGSWERGERYAVDIIEDLLRLTNGWIDWNFVVNPQGGPNWPRGFTDGAIVVDATKDEFYKQPMFYAMGHFSRFFRPGSVVVRTELEGQTEDSSDGKLMTVAVHKKDTGHLIVNILNKYNESKLVKMSLNRNLPKINDFTIEARSINTVVLKL